MESKLTIDEAITALSACKGNVEALRMAKEALEMIRDGEKTGDEARNYCIMTNCGKCPVLAMQCFTFSTERYMLGVLEGKIEREK